MVALDAKKWRGQIIDVSNTLYDEYGVDAGWKGVVPWPITEAVISRESNGNENIEDSSSGAVGLMQVIPGMNEAGAYTALTGIPVSASSLRDTRENMRVGIVGLADRQKDTASFGYPGWQYAAQAYFGAFDYEHGLPDDVAGDNNNTGRQYRDYVMNYVADAVGRNNYPWDTMGLGVWFKKDGTPDKNTVKEVDGNAFTGFLNGVTNALSGVVVGTVEAGGSAVGAVTQVQDVVDAVLNPDNWIRAFLALAGIAIVVVGTGVIIL